MSKEKNSKADKTPSNVTIIDGKLIISLPNAQIPVVWQTDLARAQSASFTIKEDKRKKAFILISKSQENPENKIDEIAVFDNKQASIDILMEISAALQNAHGKISPENTAFNANHTQTSVASNFDKDNKVGAVISLILVIILFVVWISFASNSINLKEESTTTYSNDNSSSGVPVSADDFLSSR